MPRFTLFVSLAVLISVGLRFAWPVVDHHAAERDPWHSHVVVSAASDWEYAQALAAHHHPSEHPHAHDPLTGLPLPAQAGGPHSLGSPQVLIFASAPSGLASAFEAGTQTWLLPTLSWSVTRLDSLWQALSDLVLLSLGADLPPSAPPPRAAR